MNPFPTEDGWHFYDTSKTSAEIVTGLYQAIYETAKKHHTLIMGCNTIGHLGAGLMQLQRTGDDTSGITWERTKKMGVNTLAFCLPQHGTFFDIDADCVGIMGPIPWSLNRQWADVVAESGTSLFVSAKPGVLSRRKRRTAPDHDKSFPAGSSQNPVRLGRNRLPGSMGRRRGRSRIQLVRRSRTDRKGK